MDKSRILHRTVYTALRYGALRALPHSVNRKKPDDRKRCAPQGCAVRHNGDIHDGNRIYRGYNLSENIQSQTLGLQRCMGKYPGNNLPQIFSCLGTARRTLLFSHTSLHIECARMAFEKSRLLFRRGNVLRRIYNRYRTFGTNHFKAQKIRRRKRYHSKIRNSQSKYTSKAGRKKTKTSFLLFLPFGAPAFRISP